MEPPDTHMQALERYKAAFGPQTPDIAYRLTIIEDTLQYSQKPHVFYQLLKYFLLTISSKDPTPIHFNIVRCALTVIDLDALKSDQTVAMLAAELVIACNKLNRRIQLPHSLELTNDLEKSPQTRTDFEPTFLDSHADFEEQCFSNGLSKWDAIYLNILSSTGQKGRKWAKDCAKKLEQQEEQWNQSFWFRTQDLDADHYFFHSPAFLGLTEALWEDKVRSRVLFATEQVPALTTHIYDPVTKILSPHNELVKRENQVQLFHQNVLLGASVASIPHNIIGPVFNGIAKLNTVTGHRLTRYLVRSAFNQMVNGDPDHRVLKLDRGASDIADRLGLASNRELVTIKEVIHAMAYFEFNGQILTGNLIALSKFDSRITGRKGEGWEITIGTSLIPYQTFEALKKGECGLLIPLLKDPPLIGANQFYSGQYLLQMKVMAEFSKHSVLFAQEGVIEISEKLWEELSQSCGLSKDVLRRVQDRWTQDGDDGGQFLQKVGEGFYTLGPEYEKVAEFLKTQGLIRIQASNRGKASVAKRLKVKKQK